MEYSFPRYLLAKQTVDDRALNKDVLAALKAALSASYIRFPDSRQPPAPDSASSVDDIRFSDLPHASQRGSSAAPSVPESASDLRFSASRQPPAPASASSVDDIRFSASRQPPAPASASSVDDIRFSASRQPSVSESDSALRFSASPVHPLSAPLLTVTEVGAGIGIMLTRLLRWNILPPNVDYTIVDEMPENIAFARQWLPQWARENGYQIETLLDESIRLTASRQPSVPDSASNLRFSDSSVVNSASNLRFSDSSVVNSASNLRFSDSSVVNSASSVDDIRFSDSRQPSVPQSVLVHFVQADVFDFIRFSASQSAAPSADLLIAHAFLDLLPMPESLPQLFSLLKPGGLAWLTINFDGVTTFEPPFRFPDSPADDRRFSVLRQPSAPESVSGLHFSDSSAVNPVSSASDLRFSDSSAVNSASFASDLRFSASSVDPSASDLRFSASSVVDILIERLYHQTMDTRPTGGDSRSGRHLFGHLKQAGAEILAAGASDWVVYPVNGRYPADESYFLHFILHFFETSLANHPELDPDLFQEWLKQRRAQIERAELVYIAHQMDFLISTR